MGNRILGRAKAPGTNEKMPSLDTAGRFGRLRLVSASRNTVQVRGCPATVIGEATQFGFSAGHCRDLSRWEGCEPPTTREPEDLLRLRAIVNLMVKDSDGRSASVGILFLLFGTSTKGESMNKADEESGDRLSQDVPGQGHRPFALHPDGQESQVMARAKSQPVVDVAAPSRGRYVGTGNGPAFQPIDIGHPDYVAVIEPDTAFWALVEREKLADVALGGDLVKAYRKKAGQFAKEMDTLRFGLKPSAVYFNPTERCNLNCTYCYIPEKMRRKGQHMSRERLLEALAILKRYFRTTVPKGIAAADRLPRRRADAEPRGRLRRHRAIRRRLPLRHPDQRHAAGRFGHRFPPRPRREHRHLARRAHGRDRRPHPQQLGRPRRLSSRSSTRWTGSRAIRAGA